MKKSIALILALVMILSLAACGGKPGSAAPSEPAAAPESSAPAESAPEPASEPEEAPAEAPAAVNNSAWDATIEEAYRAQLPKPEVSLFANQITDGYRATFWGATEEYMRDYVEAVKEAGFTIDAADSSDQVSNAVVWYEAYNEAGYYVVINLSDNGGGAIDILKYE